VLRCAPRALGRAFSGVFERHLASIGLNSERVRVDPL
jgi:hypothetical protein